jgi:amidophosphoribosyltransferase
MIRIDDDHFHDHCGVCGVYGHDEAAKLAYLGLYALQHRGQESAGIVSSDGIDLHLHKGMGLVQEIFRPGVLARLAERVPWATHATRPPATLPS